MNELRKRVDAWLAWSILMPVVFALVAAAPASATDTVVAHLQEPSSIRTFAGIQVFSAFEGTLLQGGIYRLAILRDDKFELLPVAPSRAPFEADIGPDRNGRPQLVYTRCTGRDPSTGRYLGCDLFTLSLASGAGEQPVSAANTSRNEVAPTLWKGRTAFARQSKDGSRAVVYTRRLGDPPSHRSKRLPGIRFGARFPGNPVRIKGGEIAELELYGDRLAEIIKLSFISEIRIVRIPTHRTRLLTRVGVGEGGQYFAGIGFADGYLAWARGGELAAIYRHRFSTGELSRAVFPRVVDFLVIGLAPFTATGAYMVDWQPGSADGCGGEEEVPPAGLPLVRPCQVIRSERLKFRPFRRASP
jgi:hypothetical protein